MKQVLLATGLLGAVLGCESREARKRFPTGDHKRYPLSVVIEDPDGDRTRRFVPYKEPALAERCRIRWKRFKALKLPLPEDETDIVRHFSGSSHKYGIPLGSGKVPEGAKGYGKYVYSSDGRIKNVFRIREDGSAVLQSCIVYDDKERYLIVGRFGKTGRDGWALATGTICEYAHGDEPVGIDLAPVRVARINMKDRFYNYTVFENGAPVRSVWTPQPPSPHERGKWPCQARRYHHELKSLVTQQGIPEAERVQAILKYTRYRPLEDEETRRGGYGYSALRANAVDWLGKLRSKESRNALLALLEDRELRATAARALAKQGDASVLPSLLKALELEDDEARTRPFSLDERNRHKASAAIVRYMLRLAPDKARGMLRKFLEERQRVFRRTIEPQLAP